MMKLGSFETVQQFWQYYSFMKRPSKVDEACDLMLVSRSSLRSLKSAKKSSLSYWQCFLVQIGNPASMGGRIKQGRGSLVDPCQATQHRQILGKCNYGHGRGTIHGWQWNMWHATFTTLPLWSGETKRGYRCHDLTIFSFLYGIGTRPISLSSKRLESRWGEFSIYHRTRAQARKWTTGRTWLHSAQL